MFDNIYIYFFIFIYFSVFFFEFQPTKKRGACVRACVRACVCVCVCVLKRWEKGNGKVLQYSIERNVKYVPLYNYLSVMYMVTST